MNQFVEEAKKAVSVFYKNVCEGNIDDCMRKGCKFGFKIKLNEYCTCNTCVYEILLQVKEDFED